nr:lyk11 isoform X1 [Solanum lycopersicum]
MIFFQENRSFELVLGLLVLNILWVGVKSQCSDDCDALASFYVWNGANLTFMSNTFSTPIKNILSYNPQITNPDIIQSQSRVNVPFSCSCVDGKFMGHQFDVQVKTNTTYPRITRLYCSNLTTVEKLQESNSYDPNNVPVNSIVKVIVNCSCGNSHVSKDYGLFITYPLRPGENLVTLANDFSLPQKLLEDYNPEANFSSGSGLVFIPGKDQNGTYPQLRTSTSSKGFSGGAITGISVAVVLVVALLAVCIYITFYRGRKTEENLNLEPYKHSSNKHIPGHANFENSSEGGSLKQGASPEVPRIAVDKSIEFSYDELAKASDNFSTAYKIGQGGFASVYYGELRGEKAAIKKMDMQATKEFLAELKVLTHVHHLNLVRLIGYCVEGSLFLVYEYIENGNLSQHLRGFVPGKVPLPWSTRVKIALDAARGLEYIHEHTVPVYIHRDIKTANILIDKNFRAKVADFGLTKLIETEGGSMNTRLVGTFGYMAPDLRMCLMRLILKKGYANW